MHYANLEAFQLSLFYTSSIAEKPQVSLPSPAACARLNPVLTPQTSELKELQAPATKPTAKENPKKDVLVCLQAGGLACCETGNHCRRSRCSCPSGSTSVTLVTCAIPFPGSQNWVGGSQQLNLEIKFSTSSTETRSCDNCSRTMRK